MGRGRQKAKQTKIARKLKYLTTDTDYDELAKELSTEDGENIVSAQSDEPAVDFDTSDDNEHGSNDMADGGPVGSQIERSVSQDDLDDYAQWAAQAAAAAQKTEPTPVRKPMPIPGGLIPKPGQQAQQSEE